MGNLNRGRVAFLIIGLISISLPGCGMIGPSVNKSSLGIEDYAKIPMKVAYRHWAGGETITFEPPAFVDNTMKEIFAETEYAINSRKVTSLGAKAYVDFKTTEKIGAPFILSIIWWLPTLTLIPGISGPYIVEFDLYSLNNEKIYEKRLERYFTVSFWWPYLGNMTPEQMAVPLLSDLAQELVSDPKVRRYAETEYTGPIAERFKPRRTPVQKGSISISDRPPYLDSEFPYSAYSGPKTFIAVLELQATADAKDIAPGLTDIMRAELLKTNRFRIVSREEMKTVLGEQEFQQSAQCDDTKCIVELGKTLGVEKIVAGNILKIGRIYSLTLKYFDVETAELLWSDYERSEGKEDMFGMINTLVLKMITGKEE